VKKIIEKIYSMEINLQSMILGYVNKEGKVIDRSGNYVKMVKRPDTVIFKDDGIKVWVWSRWIGISGERGLEKGKGKLIIGDDRIQFYRKITPMKLVEGGIGLIQSVGPVDRENKLKKAGFRDYIEFHVNEIRHVSSDWSGHTVYIESDDGKLVQIGFPKKPLEIGEFLNPYAMDPMNWLAYRQKVLDKYKGVDE